MLSSSYKQLEQRFARLGCLRDAQGILHWDRSVMMPAGGAGGAACEMAWREARAKADYAMVLPFLEEVLRLAIEAGKAKAARFGTSAYDALLDQFEPAGRAPDIDLFF